MVEIPIICPSDADLEELVRDVEDVTDPSSINKILEFLELIREGDDNLMMILTEKLGDAVIYWELPWYQKLIGLSRPYDDTDDGSNTFKKNSISSVEKEKIEKRWRKLRKVYGLPEDGLKSVARWKNRFKIRNPNCPEERARRFVVLFLAKGLERNPYQIYRHIKSHYGPSRRGSFTRTEEKIIEICLHHRPTLVIAWIAQILGREPAGVRNKMNAIHYGQPIIIKRKRLKWTLPLASKFLKLLMKRTGLELEELKNRRFEFDVWQQLESDMDQHQSYLQHFWYCYLHVQLFVRCDVKLRKLKKQLFKRLLYSSYKIWSDIDWKELVLDFPEGFTHRFIYKICFRVVKNYKIEHYLKAPLKEVAEYALQKVRRRRRTRNKRLKTLCLNENGDLELTDYKFEK